MLANSFMDCENTVDLRNVLAMFESVGEYSKSQRLRFRDGFVSGGAVRKYAGKIGYFANPAAVVFALDLDYEIAHRVILQRWFGPREIRLPNAPAPHRRAAFTCQHT